jgi:hypothetical protein
MRLFKSLFITKSLPNRLIPSRIGNLNCLNHVDYISEYCKENNVDYIMGKEFDNILKLYSSHERFLYNKIEPYIAFELYIEYENKRMKRFIQSNIGYIPKICLVQKEFQLTNKEIDAVKEACVYLEKNNIPYVSVFI